MRKPWFIAPFLAAATAWGQDDMRSILPQDYIHDQYDTAHLNETGAFLERLRPYPPMYLQVGKTAPFVHSLGPIAGHEGENQGIPGYTERMDYARLLSPDELRERIVAIRRFTEGAKKLGCQYVLPYACCLTMFGEPDQRLGLHQVYDRWAEYEEWLGPRPPLDPSEWVARNPDGSPWFWYGPRKPQYDPLIRYTTCLQNPGWRAWMGAVVRNLAAAGYNGVMLDNACKMRCYCSYCQRRFQEYLREKYTPEQLEALFGVQDYAQLPLYRRGADAVVPQTAEAALMIETQRFELVNIVEFLRFLRAEGRKVDPGFIVCGNVGHLRHIDYAFSELDVGLIESHGWWGAFAPLNVTPQRYPGVLRRGLSEAVNASLGDAPEKVINNRFIYATAQMIPGPHRSYHMTTYEVQDAAAIPNRHTVLLAYAEAAAYSGGHGIPMPYYSTPFVRAPANDEFHWMRKGWFRFVAQHADLLQGFERDVALGIVFEPTQQFLYSDLNSHLEAAALARYLEAQSIDYELIPGRRCRPEYLRQYRAVLVPQMTYLGEEMLSGLMGYAEAGGALLVSGAAAQYDYAGRPREPARNPFAHPPDKAVSQKQVGQGRLIFYPPYPVHRDPEEPDFYKSFHLGPLDDEALRRALSLAGLDEADLRMVSEPSLHHGFTRWIKRDGDSATVVIHALNYNVAPGLNTPQPVVPLKQLKLQIPLPEGLQVTQATSYEPLYPNETNFAVCEVTRAIPFRPVAPDRVEVTVEELAVYQLIALSCQR